MAPDTNSPKTEAMHEYRRFVQEQMDLRRMRPADVERAGGPSRQVLSKLLNDNRDSLDRRPDNATVTALAKAFRIDVEHVLASVARAMGLPTSVTIAGLEAASNEELLGEIRRRMESTHEQDADPDHTHDRERESADDGPVASSGEKTGGVGLDQMDFDLAAHPDMPLERDRFDAEHGDAGEENQDNQR